MARIPRLHRVRSLHRDGTVDQRTYQTPKAAAERVERFRIADPDATISTTASHPITFPHEAGDAALLEIPDTSMQKAVWETFCSLQLGVSAEAVVAVHVADDTLVVEYDADHSDPARKGKRAPRLWRVYLEK